MSVDAFHEIAQTEYVMRAIALYSALGHTAAAYQQADYRIFLENAVEWILTQQ